MKKYLMLIILVTFINIGYVKADSVLKREEVKQNQIKISLGSDVGHVSAFTLSIALDGDVKLANFIWHENIKDIYTRRYIYDEITKTLDIFVATGSVDNLADINRVIEIGSIEVIGGSNCQNCEFDVIFNTTDKPYLSLMTPDYQTINDVNTTLDGSPKFKITLPDSKLDQNIPIQDKEENNVPDNQEVTIPKENNTSNKQEENKLSEEKEPKENQTINSKTPADNSSNNQELNTSEKESITDKNDYVEDFYDDPLVEENNKNQEIKKDDEKPLVLKKDDNQKKLDSTITGIVISFIVALGAGILLYKNFR